MSDTSGGIRISPWEQNQNRQPIAINGLSIPEQTIFLDKQSERTLTGLTKK